MRAGVERLARRWWAGELGSGGALLDVLAAPLSWSWSAAGRLRTVRLGGSGRRVEGLRVVSVGNLGVGGTGKTPVAAWVVGRLLEAGLPTALVVGDAGRDEALLHERWNPQVPVVVGRDRVGGAAAARAAGARAAVLDDAFQHLRIARDLDIALLSADDAFPGHVLPRGPYRERPGALARAGVVIVTRRGATDAEARGVADRAGRYAPRALSAGASLAPRGVFRLGAWATGGGTGHTGDTPSGPVLAACAVGRPDAFGEAVRDVAGGPVELLTFRDHHPYGAQDVARIRRSAGGRPVIVTEKDAVKLAPHAAELGETWVLTEELRWSWGEAALRERLAALAEESVGP